MEKQLVSVVIPTLNEELFLPNLLSDLSRQTQKLFEVIIVDACSTDKTVEVAESFSQMLAIHVLRVSQKNVSFQRNYGAKHTDSNHLVFLDADSRIPKNFIENVVKSLNKKNILLVPLISPDVNKPFVKLFFIIANLVIRLSQRFGQPFCGGGFIIISKHLFHQIKGFDESLYLAEDHDLIQRAQRVGVRAKILSKSRVTSSTRRIMKEGQLRVVTKYIIATAYLIVKGRIRTKIFEYEMGGQGYSGYLYPLFLTSPKLYFQRKKVKYVSLFSFLTENQFPRMRSVALIGFFLLLVLIPLSYPLFGDSANKRILDKATIASKIKQYRQYEQNLVAKILDPVEETYFKNFNQKENNFTTGFLSV